MERSTQYYVMSSTVIGGQKSKTGDRTVHSMVNATSVFEISRNTTYSDDDATALTNRSHVTHIPGSSTATVIEGNVTIYFKES